MPGFFTGTGSTRELGRTARAVTNIGLGNTVYLWSTCWSYYSSLPSNVQLSASFAGRFYPFTY